MKSKDARFDKDEVSGRIAEALRRAKLPNGAHWVIGKTFVFTQEPRGRHINDMVGQITGLTISVEGALVLSVSNRTSPLTGPNEIIGIVFVGDDDAEFSWQLSTITHRERPSKAKRTPREQNDDEMRLFADRINGNLILL